MALPTSSAVSTAQPGLMLQATDDPTKIFMLQVDSTGTVTATAIRARGRAAMMHPHHRKLERLLDRMGGFIRFTTS